jgi:hypothetical protein
MLSLFHSALCFSSTIYTSIIWFVFSKSPLGIREKVHQKYKPLL